MNKIFSFWTKTHFLKNQKSWQRVDPILQDVSVAEKVSNGKLLTMINFRNIIFHCSKNNGSPTGVTRLKVATKANKHDRSDQHDALSQ